MPAAAADAWSSSACVPHIAIRTSGAFLANGIDRLAPASIIRSKPMPAAVSSCRRWTTGAGDLSHGWYPDDHATIHPNGKFNFQGNPDPRARHVLQWLRQADAVAWPRYTQSVALLAQLSPPFGPILAFHHPNFWPSLASFTHSLALIWTNVPPMVK